MDTVGPQGSEHKELLSISRVFFSPLLKYATILYGNSIQIAPAQASSDPRVKQ